MPSGVEKKVRCPVCGEEGVLRVSRKQSGSYLEVVHGRRARHYIGPTAETLRARFRKLLRDLERVARFDPEAKAAVAALGEELKRLAEELWRAAA